MVVAFLKIILGLALCVQAFIGLAFFMSSIWEKEKRASLLGGLQFIGMLVPVVLFFILNTYDFFDSGVGLGIMILVLIMGIAAVILFFSRIGANPKALQGTKGLIVGAVKRWDERDIQFSNVMRMEHIMLKIMPQPGDAPDFTSETPDPQVIMPGDGPLPEEFKEKMKALSDEEMNSAGMGPLRVPPNTGKIDGPSSYPLASMARASAELSAVLAYPELFAPKVQGSRFAITPEAATSRVKGYALHLGAVLVGITELNRNWLYSHRGCSGVHLGQWGKEINVDHQYGIVFAEEMDREMISSGPHTPCIMESMKNYAKGAFIGFQLAGFIANMGYSARANQVAHYDALMVPLAVDAGLGELSRMGYLISKEYGPRIRLSAVTTDLPLIPDKPVDIGVRDFCRICKKCARCCPSRSIPLDDEPEEVNGSLRWKMNADTCFQFWQKSGTDCSVCMSVCPWGHARTFPHKIIVEAVSRNKISRRLFKWMDDVFYGKKPRPKDPPGWANFRTSLTDRPPTEEEIEMFSGTWRLTMETPAGTETPLLLIKEGNGTLTGNMDGDLGKPELDDIRVNGNNFSFKMAVKGPMGMMRLDFGGVISGDVISGNFFSPMGPAQFTGKRQ